MVLQEPQNQGKYCILRGLSSLALKAIEFGAFTCPPTDVGSQPRSWSEAINFDLQAPLLSVPEQWLCFEY